MSDTDTDARPTPGPAYADGRYVVATPERGRPNGEAILSPTGYGNDLPGPEQRANAALAAAAFNAAHELDDEYDAVGAVEALPELVDIAHRIIADSRLGDAEAGEPDPKPPARALLIELKNTLEQARRK